MDELMVLVGQIGNLVFAPKWMYRTPENFVRSVIIPFMDSTDATVDSEEVDSPTFVNMDPDSDDADFSLALSPEDMINEARTVMLLQVLETRYLRPDEETGGPVWVEEPSEGTPVWVVDFDRLEREWSDLDDGSEDESLSDDDDD